MRNNPFVYRERIQFGDVNNASTLAGIVALFRSTEGVDPLNVGNIPFPQNLAAAPSASGGTLATGTYGYRVTAVVGGTESPPSPEVTAAVTGPTGSVVLTWTAVPGAASYNVYGRTPGSELKLSSPASATYTDTAAATPAGAMPGFYSTFTNASVNNVYGSIENNGAASFTLTMSQSNDNAVADPYAALNFRAFGAQISSLVIQPGGIAEWSCESIGRRYVRFDVSPQPGSIGNLSVLSRSCRLEKRLAVGVP